MKSVGYISGQSVVLDLVCIGGTMYLHRPAAIDFLSMSIAAAKDGIILRVNSAHRTMQAQEREYAARLEHLRRYPDKPYKLVARPGWSTHQSGCSVDINRAHDEGKTDAWLAANASRFGFYNDVPSEKWHWSHLATIKSLRFQAGLS